MSEIRLDRIENQYVLMAPERLHRPNIGHVTTKKRPSATCAFCEGNEALTPPEVFAMRENEANAMEWRTRVVPNLYKAVQVELESSSQRDGMFESIAGVGAHEIVIDTPQHDAKFSTLGVDEIENWLRSILIRLDDLQHDKRLIYANVFKNHGFNAGATQEHPHTQILALPIMPKNSLDFLERNMRYYRRHGRGKIEDIVMNEVAAKIRVIDKVGSFVAFCPYASAFPFEVMIAPLKNIHNLAHCSRKDITNLAHIIKKVFAALAKQLGDFDYNLYFNLSPLNSNFENEAYMQDLDKNFRFSMRITPRIYRLGGFEVSTGMAINSVLPQECARLLRGD
jgi:UDPglucose--hexose-1-phosphate uridylyltransferase